jgi:acyl-CoA hydrolase
MRVFALLTAAEVFEKTIVDGSTVVTAMAASEPHSFFRALCERANSRRGVTVYCANPNQSYSCFQDSNLVGHVSFHVMFLTAGLKIPQGRGLVHYVPQHLSQWASHLKEREVDVFWGVCSPPNAQGYVNLGLNLCYESEMVRHARVVVLEVVENLPVVAGDTWVHVSEVDHFVESSGKLCQIRRSQPSARDLEIGRHVADLVPNEATIQLGIGRIPDAVAVALRGKHDLGVHTELFTETMKDLFLSGSITCRRKTLFPRKMVASFVLGSQELYDFVNGHPAVELLPSSFVNNPYWVGKNHRMHSINTAVEVDITGQVCSESVGHRELSGVGGATDTHIGAQRSAGGRGIIAIPSTTDDGAHSKIVFELKPGAKVSISRNDVDTIVTEYGVARLRGLSVAERVERLIALAAPEFRTSLREQAVAVGYL